jgi:hypothetical protein
VKSLYSAGAAVDWQTFPVFTFVTANLSLFLHRSVTCRQYISSGTTTALLLQKVHPFPNVQSTVAECCNEIFGWLSLGDFANASLSITTSFAQ